MADCILTKTCNSLGFFSAIWSLLYWVLLMICFGKEQALNLSVVYLVEWTMTWAIYIWCMITWVSSRWLKSLNSMSAMDLVVFSLLCMIGSANNGGGAFYVGSQVNNTMQWSIWLWWPNMDDSILKKTFNTLVLFSTIWVLGFWLSLMNCFGNAQTLLFLY